MNFFITLGQKINQFWNKKLVPFAHKPWYFLVLLACTLLDAVIFIIPSDFILMFSVLAHPQKTVLFMLSYCVGGTLSQSLFYWVSMQHSSIILAYLGTFFDATATMARAAAWLNEWGPLGIVPVGISPVPLQFIMVACGMANSPWPQVMTYLLIARVLRSLIFILLAKWGRLKMD